MSHIHPRRHPHPWTTLAAALGATAVIALAVAGCVAPAPADEPPEPTATLLSAPWTVEPESHATPPPFVAPLTAGDVQATADIVAFATSLSATVAALASPAATSEPAVAVNTVVPIAGCGVPLAPPNVAVRMDADSSSAAESWWYFNDPSPRQFEGDVVSVDGDGDGTVARITSHGDIRSFNVTVTTDVPLPLTVGRHVTVHWHDDRRQAEPAGNGLGYGLLIMDDEGLVALVVASATAPAESAALLKGERGGAAVHQLKSPCGVGASMCGLTLYAAPVTFTIGGSSSTISPGETGVLAASRDGGPSYGIRLATSFSSVTEGLATCADESMWFLSYSVVRR